MGVVRGDQTLLIAVPVVHWTPQSLWRHMALRPELVVGLLGALVFFALALFTFYQRSDIPASRALVVLSATFLAINISGLLPDGLSVQFNQPAFFATGAFSYLIIGVLLAPALLAFTLLFPHPKRILRRHPWLAFLPFGVGILVGVIIVTGGMPVLGWVATLVMIAAAIASFIHSGFTQRDDISRSQFRWAVGGSAAGMLLVLLVFPAAAGLVTHPLLADLMASGLHLGFTVIGIALGTAILRHRLFELDLVINRALVYGTLTLCVIGIYVLVVGYLGMLFQAKAARRCPPRDRHRGSPVRALARRGAARGKPLDVRPARRTIPGADPARPAAGGRPGTLVGTVSNGADRRPGAQTPIRRDCARRKMAADRAVFGAAQNEVWRFPLVHASQTIGELAAASRVPNESLTPADRRLLSDLARHIGVAAHAALLAANLEQARLSLVTERGEARRKLGSDLHDGVGHQLVGLTRQVERVTALTADDPTLTRSLTGIGDN